MTTSRKTTPGALCPSCATCGIAVGQSFGIRWRRRFGQLGTDMRMVVFRDYLIFYRYSQDRVVIERVVHGARDIRGLL